MTPAELQALVDELEAAEAQAPAPAAAAPPPPPEKTWRDYDPLLNPFRGNDPLIPNRGEQQSPLPPETPAEQAVPAADPSPVEVRAKGWRPLPGSVPSVQEEPVQQNIPPAEEGTPGAIEWDPRLAEAMGMPLLAEKIRDYKATVFGVEGDAKARMTVLRQGNRAFGRFNDTISIPAMEEELAMASLSRDMNRFGIKDFYDLPPERQKQLITVAKDRAHRKVMGIVAASPRRGNTLIDLDPEGTMRRIREGDTWAGWLTGMAGQKAVRDIVGAAGYAAGLLDDPSDHIPVIDDALDLERRLMAPFWAILTPGAASVQPQGDTPVLGIQKESKLSWFFRAGLASVIGAHVFDPNQKLFEDWGSEAHIRRIYQDGYDFTQEMGRFGEGYAALTPWADSETAKAIAGFGGVMAIVMVEPDLTLLTLKAAAPFKVIAKGAKPAKLMLETTFNPAIAKWITRLEGATDKMGELKAIEGELRPGSQLHSAWQAIRFNWLTKMLASNADLYGENAGSAIRNMDRILEQAEKAALKAEEKRVAAKAVVNKADDVLAAAEEGSTAAAAVVTSKREQARFMEQLLKVVEEENSHLRMLQDAASSTGSTVRDVQLEKLREASEQIITKMAESIGVDGPRFRRAIETGEDLFDTKLLTHIDPDLIAQHNRLIQSIGATAAGMAEGAIETKLWGLRMARLWGMERLAKIYADAGVAMPRMFEAFRLPNLVKATAAEMATATRRIRRTTPLGADVFEGMARAKKLAQAERKAAVAAKKAADEIVEKAYEGLEATQGDYVKVAMTAMRAMFGERAIRDSGELMIDVLREAADQTKLYAKMIREGVENARPDAPQLVMRQFAKAGEADATKVLRALSDRYTPDVIEAAGKAYPEALEVLTSGGKVPKASMASLFDFERAAFQAAESNRLQQVMMPRMALETIRQTPVPGTLWADVAKPEYWLARGMRLSGQVTRLVDPIISRGLASSPEIVKTVYRNIAERFHTADVHINRLAAEAAHRARKAGLDEAGVRAAVRKEMEDLLLSDKQFHVGGALVTLNQGGMNVATKALHHLKLVAKAGEATFKSDITAQAIARAWAPTRNASPRGIARALNRFYKLVQMDEVDTGEKLLRLAQNELASAMLSAERATDASDVASRFIYRGLLHGATQYDATNDLMRTANLGVTASASKALDFLTGKAVVHGPADVREVVDGFDAVKRIITNYNLPATQEIATGLRPGAGFFKMFGSSARAVNDLVKVADGAEYAIEVPRYFREAVNQIPRALAKEIQQYNVQAPYVTRLVSDFGRMWRISVVNGWFFPRIAHFTNTYFGDWSQLVARAGFVPATRITLQHTVNQIPFIGPKVQDAISDWTRKNSKLSAIMNPDLSAIFRGADDVLVETADGAMSAKRILREGYEDGMLDSISTADLADTLARVPAKRWEGFLGWVPDPTKPSRFVRNMAEYMETIQHRIRMQTYLEARTGSLTGTPLTRNKARGLVLETLYDWRMGTTAWEAETIGRIAVFWTLRRQMLRQMGSIFSEGFADGRSSRFLWEVTGNTQLGRVRKMGAMMNALPEAIYWTDPDAELSDEMQFHEWARRQAPWWVDVQPMLMSRRLEPPRELWYSEVTGKDVNYEALILPALTTLDALYTMSLIANTAAATATAGLHEVGLAPNMGTAPTAMIWERNVDEFTGWAGPGFDVLLSNAIRPLLGEQKRASSRGQVVTQQTAVLLTRLGWGEYLATYEDKSGKTRYLADPNAMAIAARLFAASPPFQDIARNWSVVDNPAMSESVTSGLVEAGARLSGLLRYGPVNPGLSQEFELFDQKGRFDQTLRRTQAEAAER